VGEKDFKKKGWVADAIEFEADSGLLPKIEPYLRDSS